MVRHECRSLDETSEYLNCNVIYSIFCQIRQSEKDNFDLTRVFMMCIEYVDNRSREQVVGGIEVPKESMEGVIFTWLIIL